MFKGSNREETKNRASRMKPAQLKKHDICTTQYVKVQEGTTEGKCDAGPVLTRAQAKKSDKIYPLKVKQAMSSVDKSTVEDLQRKDSAMNNKYFD